VSNQEIIILGQLNWWYTLIENFYNDENRTPTYEYKKVAMEKITKNGSTNFNEYLEHNLHGFGGPSSNVIPSPFENNEEDQKDSGENRFNTIEHQNYQISTLECVCEHLKNENDMFSKMTSMYHNTVEYKKKEKFNRIYFSLKNIVRTSCYNMKSEEIENMTIDVIEQIVCEFINHS